MSNKSTIGFLGIMQELYDNTYPDITERQTKYAKEVIASLGSEIDIYFPKVARCRHDIDEIVADFNHKKLDGIIIVNLTYGPAMRLVNAFKDNNLPVMLANIQPLSEITDEWDMSHLTFNQGIHGIQDTSNSLMRLGYNCPIITEDWRSSRFKEFVIDFAHAAKAKKRLKTIKVAIFGQMPAMGDIITDAHTFMRVIGAQVDHVNIGIIAKNMEIVTDDEINKVKLENLKNMDIDENLPKDRYDYACRLQVAIERFLNDNNYDAFSIYFEQIGLDGRFKQLHMMAASNLMAKGYGYAAEGDSICATLLSACFSIASEAHFTEMYAMDFKSDSILQSHMGEGNWKIARKDKKPKLIDRFLGIGGLDNPPTVLFQAQPGEGRLVSLFNVNGEHYRLVSMLGDVLDSTELPNLEMPYFYFKPKSGMRKALDKYIEVGGTHHQVFHFGDKRRRWELLCQLLNIEYVEV